MFTDMVGFSALTQRNEALALDLLADQQARLRPLFVQHGRNDPRVPVGESEHIHRVLTEKGVRCDLLIFEDEGHTVEKLPNRIETFERAVAFLDGVLAPAQPPVR